MVSESGFTRALRLIAFVVIVANALLLVVYLRTQKLRLDYRSGRASAEIRRETAVRRELDRELQDELEKARSATPPGSLSEKSVPRGERN